MSEPTQAEVGEFGSRSASINITEGGEFGPKGPPPTEQPAGANGPDGPSLPGLEAAIADMKAKEARVHEGRAGRLRDYVKACVDGGDYESAGRAMSELAVLERGLPSVRESDRLSDVERVVAALLAGARKGPDGRVAGHPHFESVLRGDAVRFRFATVDGKLSADFVPVKVSGK